MLFLQAVLVSSGDKAFTCNKASTWNSLSAEFLFAFGNQYDEGLTVIISLVMGLILTFVHRTPSDAAESDCMLKVFMFLRAIDKMMTREQIKTQNWQYWNNRRWRILRRCQKCFWAIISAADAAKIASFYVYHRVSNGDKNSIWSARSSISFVLVRQLLVSRDLKLKSVAVMPTTLSIEPILREKFSLKRIVLVFKISSSKICKRRRASVIRWFNLNMQKNTSKLRRSSKNEWGARKRHRLPPPANLYD